MLHETHQSITNVLDLKTHCSPNTKSSISFSTFCLVLSITKIYKFKLHGVDGSLLPRNVISSLEHRSFFFPRLHSQNGVTAALSFEIWGAFSEKAFNETASSLCRYLWWHYYVYGVLHCVRHYIVLCTTTAM